MECVSWDDAKEFCKRLSAKEGRSYRLPTEAEWEYACRAGTIVQYYWGAEMNDDSCWYNGNSGEKTSDVGLKKPNGWGLYDMSGNVWEWCSDWYSEQYQAESQTDPLGPLSGEYRILRGGAWNNNVRRCLSSFRAYCGPMYRYSSIGFRVAMTPQK
jgi:formylglycine-generating enzyme required for sulfatase activity